MRNIFTDIKYISEKIINADISEIIRVPDTGSILRDIIPLEISTHKKLLYPSTFSPMLYTSPCPFTKFFAYRKLIKASSEKYAILIVINMNDIQQTININNLIALEFIICYVVIDDLVYECM